MKADAFESVRHAQEYLLLCFRLGPTIRIVLDFPQASDWPRMSFCRFQGLR
jgi:hypothetical protein